MPLPQEAGRDGRDSARDEGAQQQRLPASQARWLCAPHPPPPNPRLPQRGRGLRAACPKPPALKRQKHQAGPNARLLGGLTHPTRTRQLAGLPAASWVRMRPVSPRPRGGTRTGRRVEVAQPRQQAHQVQDGSQDPAHRPHLLSAEADHLHGLHHRPVVAPLLALRGLGERGLSTRRLLTHCILPRPCRCLTASPPALGARRPRSPTHTEPRALAGEAVQGRVSLQVQLLQLCVLTASQHLRDTRGQARAAQRSRQPGPRQPGSSWRRGHRPRAGRAPFRLRRTVDTTKVQAEGRCAVSRDPPHPPSESGPRGGGKGLPCGPTCLPGSPGRRRGSSSPPRAA